MMRELEYAVLDVFAERALAGNPLAVFADGRGLNDAEMQAIAREMNLSETTFIVPGDAEDERLNGVRVRIFTTDEELPFAGHPTLGTASWLYLNHPVLRGAETITLQLNVGPIVVRFDRRDAGAGVVGTMRQNDPVFRARYSRAEVAAAIGLRENDLDEEHVPQTVSTGMPFCVVLLRSMEALGRLRIDQAVANRWLGDHDAKFFYCIARTEETTSGAGFRARMQFYGSEDPATGSAAGCCISWLVSEGLVRPDEAVVIEQGVEMLRPSRITAQAGMEGGRVCDIFVSGRTILVAAGRFFLP